MSSYFLFSNQSQLLF